MASATDNKLKLKLYNEVDSSIGDKGCESLSRADWPYLSKLNLSHSQIGGEGVKYLTNANWLKLKIIDLSNTIMFRPKLNRRQRLQLFL